MVGLSYSTLEPTFFALCRKPLFSYSHPFYPPIEYVLVKDNGHLDNERRTFYCASTFVVYVALD